jgi:hypothetical protein
LILGDFPAKGEAMLTWKEFSEARPDLAEAARSLYYQFGVGLAFLGTVRKDGGPRTHPMCPVIVDDGLYAFIEPGPKRYDLDRDGRYALHCFPPANNEDAAYITGRAERRKDPELVTRVRAVFWQERKVSEPPESGALSLYEFLIERCLLTRTTGHGDWNPQHTIWKATGGAP